MRIIDGRTQERLTADRDRLEGGYGRSHPDFKAAEKGVNGVLTLLEQTRTLVESARSEARAEITKIATQFTELASHMKNLADYSTYRGTNLFSNQSFTVECAETRAITLSGIDSRAEASCLGDIQATDSGYNNFATQAEMQIPSEALQAILEVVLTR